MSSIESSLIEYVSGNLLEGSVEGLDADTPLLELNILDSVEVLTIVQFMQSEFGVAVPVGRVVPENFGSVRAMCGLVAELKQEANGV